MKRLVAGGVPGGWFAVAVLAAALASPRPVVRPIEHVFLVSVDGLMPATYLDPDAHGLQVPLLRQIVREGAYSPGVRSVFPTVTYPSHTAMATGTNPGTSGISTNYAFDPLNRNPGGWNWYAEDIRVPTLWDAARARGLRTALVSWPATVGARADFLVPEYARSNATDNVKLIRALSIPRDALERTAARFPNFYQGFVPPRTTDESLTDIALYAIQAGKPNLLLLHIFDVDHWQHEKGLFSPEAKAAIEGADVQLGRLIQAAKEAGMWDRTVLMVVSDHGFAPVSKRVRPGVLLRENGLITLDANGHITDWKACVATDGGMAQVFVKDGNDQQTRETLRRIFSPLPGKPDSGIGRMFTQEQIAAMGGDRQAFLALEGAAGYAMASGYQGDYVSAATIAATHGYAPDQPAMLASMLVYGPSVGTGRIEHAREIDVGPTIARWLGLELRRAEGQALQIPSRTPAQSHPSKASQGQ